MVHHRRISSQWVPASPPLSPLFVFRSFEDNSCTREIVPNHLEDCDRYLLPNYRRYRDNSVSTTKYNALTFVPKNLYEQFHRLANIYFILIVVLDLCPVFSPFNRYLPIVPVVIILSLTALKDLVEDLRRRRSDNQVNLECCHVWDRDKGRFRRMHWKHILVGDMIHVSNDEVIPADILIIRSSDSSGIAFVETANLDGESNLKQRSVPRLLLPFCDEFCSAIDFEATISCDPPDKDVEHVSGFFEGATGKQTFTSKNLLLRGCQLRNTTFVEGIVIYAGHDTKLMMNNGRTPYKRSAIELLSNWFVIACAGLLLVLVIFSCLARAIWRAQISSAAPFGVFAAESPAIDALITTGAFLLSFQVLIPLSLYITVEIIKLGQAYLMTQDVHLYSPEKDEPFVCRSLTTGEDLGQVTHLMTDKTGTLTENKMIYRRGATMDSTFDEGTVPHILPLSQEDHFLRNMSICNSVFVNNRPRHDLIEVGFLNGDVFSIGNSSFYNYNEEMFDEKVALYEEDGIRETAWILEGESPDEIALVRGAKLFGYSLLRRGAHSVAIRTPFDDEETYDVLHTIPFDSRRKRMSVIVREGNGVRMYTKGADSAMFPSHASDHPLAATLNEYARLGLRTLVMATRVIPHREFQDWHTLYTYVETMDGDRDQLLSEAADKIEQDMELLGVVGIEDKLQIREAGVQIWVLTGDKRETAEGVARACSLFDDEGVHVDDISDLDSVGIERNVVLSPKVISQFSEHKEKMVEMLLKCKCVLCYRMSPALKAEIVTCMKGSGRHIASIGDGANDVPMIQAANVGIGVTGHEGTQAAMAGDFVISQFSFISRLLLVHGHLNYSRLSSAFLYFLCKNAMQVFMLFVSGFLNGFSAAGAIDPVYSMLYPIIFTSVQPLLFGMYDQDELPCVLMAEPWKYETGRLSQAYTTRLFVYNMIDAFWQGAVIFLIGFLTYTDTETSYWQFGFFLATAMFFANTVHLMLITRCWTWPLVASHIFFTCIHFSFFIVYDEVCGAECATKDPPIGASLDMMARTSFWLALVLTVVVCLFPRFTMMVIRNSPWDARDVTHHIVARRKESERRRTPASSHRACMGTHTNCRGATSNREAICSPTEPASRSNTVNSGD